MKKFKLVLGLVFLFTLVLQLYIPLPVNKTAAASSTTLGALEIGARVVDNSWEWEHRTGDGYTGTGETKPVTWIVVAKDHYTTGSGITLLAEELIGKFPFDKFDDDFFVYNGFNHWGDSGTTTGAIGLRPWLNSTGSGITNGGGFYDAFSPSFKDAVLITGVPNEEFVSTTESAFYPTSDKVFIPSTTELGETDYTDTYEIGTVYPFFSGATDTDRITKLAGEDVSYWTRSPITEANNQYVSRISAFGYSTPFDAISSNVGVRPALNLLSDTPLTSLTYHGNTSTGGSVPTDDLNYIGGFDITTLDEGSLEKTGYTFVGWNTQADGNGINYTAGGTYNMSTAAIILYAQWVPTYTVAYDANGATGGTVPATQIKTHDQDLTLATNSGNLVRTGHTFAGWNTAADGSGTDYAEGANYAIDASITLYARWEVPVTVPLISLILSPSALSLETGQTGELTPVFQPSDATNKNVTWSSSNTDVASVSANGLVLAKAAGTATITATAADGGHKGICVVTVTEPEAVTGVTLNHSLQNLEIGETLELEAVVRPSNAANKNVTWSSSNTNVASVSANGLVTARAGGTATITVTTADGGFKDSCIVNVIVPVSGISLNESTLSIAVGETARLIPGFQPENATNRNVSWTSGNQAVATVSSHGLVTAKAAGTVTITVTTADGGFEATCAVTVFPAVPVTSVTLNKSTLILRGGDVKQLTAVIEPANATNQKVRWRSSNTIVATVTAEGTVTAVIPGTATITATADDGGDTASCTVTVVKEEETAVTVLGALEIGARVVDKSWEWKHRTGDNYSGSGETKPVTWIVVAKDHYITTGSSVTLLAEELIGRFVFDYIEENDHGWGLNHWGESGTHARATHGLRPWLNSSGIHAGEGFYEAFSLSFKDAVLTTPLPNTARDYDPDNQPWGTMPGLPYITEDKVFIPSTTELGDPDAAANNTYEIGSVFQYFVGKDDASRIAPLGGNNKWYRTRSPDSSSLALKDVNQDGNLVGYASNPDFSYTPVRPALNLKAETPVSQTPNARGYYEIIWEEKTEPPPLPSGDASLKELEVNGVGLRDFSPREFNYGLELVAGTTVVPTVTATANHELALVEISEAGELPGISTVTVTAEDGVTVNRYELAFNLAPAAPSPVGTLGDLKIGDRVVDKSWRWEFRTGPDEWEGEPYSGTGEIKPVSWIVVARDHYGDGSGITLLTEDLIGKFSFDNSKHVHLFGSNHWGNSGTDDTATYGLRPWLNSSGIHAGEGFYHAFSDSFKGAVLTTDIPNREWERGTGYTTRDQVFIPSTTELGDTTHDTTYRIGNVFPYFAGAGNWERLASLAGINWWYWTRSPDSRYSYFLRLVFADGSMGYLYEADLGSTAVRPALNMSAATPVSLTPNAGGYYEICWEKAGEWKVWEAKDDVPGDKEWVIAFNKTIDRDMLSGENIFITAKNDQLVPIYSVGVHPDTDKKICVKPLQDYTVGETYTLWIKNLRSLEGKVLSENVKMDFTIRGN